MADPIIIPPPGQIQTVAAGGQQTQSATESNSPRTSLPQGSLVSGTIGGKDESGNYVLKSAQGNFAVQSKVPLTYNSDVVIRIGANNANNNSARIVSVNGEPFAEFATPEASSEDSVSPALLSQPTTPASSNAPATTFTGVVVAAPAASSNTSQLAEGTTVVVRIPATAQNTDTTQEQSSPTPSTASPPTPGAPVIAGSIPVPAAASAPIAVSAQAAIAPTQVAQSTQAAIVQPSSAPLASPPATAPVAVATVAQTELAPSQTVGPAASGDGAQNQNSHSQTSQNEVVATPPALPTSDTEQSQVNQTPATAPPALTNQPASVSTSPSVGTPTSVITSPSVSTPPSVSNAQYSAYTKQSGNAPAAGGTLTAQPVLSNSATVTSPPATTSIPAQVLNVDENGNLALQTPLGNITVKATLPALASIPAGTNITLELLTEIAQAGSSEPAALNELASSWQSLKDIITVTNASDASATPALLARLPQLGPDFLSNSTSFISALLQGDARKLLGDDTVDRLEQMGRQDLVDKFSSELSTLGAAFNAPADRQVSNWQLMFLPFVFQEVLQQARIYVKKDAPKKEKNAKSTADTRFIVEVDLSELGPMQMDGLIRKKEKATAFDLVIRSHHAFSAADQAQMVSIYNSAAELTGFKGSLGFQVTRDFPVKPLEEVAGNSARSITA